MVSRRNIPLNHTWFEDDAKNYVRRYGYNFTQKRNEKKELKWYVTKNISN